MTNTLSVRRLAFWLGALVAIGPFSIDTYIPALPSMADDLHTVTSEVERSVGLYLVGAAIGQLFGGPVSDRFGRKRVAVICLALYVITSLAITFITDVFWLDVLRMVQAVGGGITVITSGATVRDYFQGREAARMITAIGVVMLMAPLVAPTVGTALLKLGGWHLIFYSLAGYGLFLIAVVLLVLPDEAATHARDTSGLLARWKRVLGFAPASALMLCNGFAFSAIFAFITDSAFLYLEFYRVGETWFPFYFGANVVAMILFNRLNVLLLRRFESFQIMTVGLAALALACIGVLTQFIVLGKPPLATLVPNIMLIGGLVALVMPNGIATLLHLFPRDSGTASGLNGTNQYLIAGGAGVVLSVFHNGTPVPMASVMLVSALLAVVLLSYARRRHDLTLPAPGQSTH